MEIYQLRTFLAVAGEGSITRASEVLFLSQPAVSAHIKSLEEELGLTLFERTTKGMSLTPNGARLYAKAEQMLSMHRDLLDEARRIKGKLSGKVRLGSARNPSARMLSKLLGSVSANYPELEVTIQYGSSVEVLQGIRSGNLDAGFFVDAGIASADLESIEVHRFGIYLAAAPGMVNDARRLDWAELARLPWVCPSSSTCCGLVAERLFQAHDCRPAKIVNVDQESVTRTLIGGGVGIGLLHEETAFEAQGKGEVELLGEVAQQDVRLVFAYQSARGQESLVSALASTVCALVAEGP